MGRYRAMVIGSVLVVAMATCISACSSGEALTLTGDEMAREPCPTTTSIPVETLDELSTDECDPLGSSLEFPDGEQIAIGGGTGSTTAGEDSYTYGYVNVGTLGIVATRYIDGCRDQEVWGSDAAIAKVRDAFGPALGAC